MGFGLGRFFHLVACLFLPGFPAEPDQLARRLVRRGPCPWFIRLEGWVHPHFIPIFTGRFWQPKGIQCFLAGKRDFSKGWAGLFWGLVVGARPVQVN